MFCMFPGSKSEWKKWATSQSFIRKEITSYRIGTLAIHHMDNPIPNIVFLIFLMFMKYLDYFFF